MSGTRGKKAVLSQQQLPKTPHSRKKKVCPCSKYRVLVREVCAGGGSFDLGRALWMLFTQGLRELRAPDSL